MEELHKTKNGVLDFVALVGSLASIGSLFIPSDIPTWIKLVASLFITLLLLIPYLIQRFKNHPIWGRKKLIETGTNLIKQTKDNIVLYGGDCSWVNDYIGAIREVKNAGKQVYVVYPKEKLASAKSNIEQLTQLGVKIITTTYDLRIRAMVIDHDVNGDAIVYIASRHRDVGNINQESTKYIAFVFSETSSHLVTKTMVGITKYILAGGKVEQ